MVVTQRYYQRSSYSFVFPCNTPILPQCRYHALILHNSGRPNLNLASFVGTYMERDAEQLMIENLSKNMSDADEYPAMMAMHARCISIISHLWGVQKGETAIGSATTGSSEAIHLGGLAMKRRWQEKRMQDGKDKSKPNILMGSNAQGMSILSNGSNDLTIFFPGPPSGSGSFRLILMDLVAMTKRFANCGTICSCFGKVCQVFRSRSSYT